MIQLDCPREACTKVGTGPAELDERGDNWGKLKVRVFRDWTGDPSVPNGTYSWWDMEVDEQSCRCEYSDEEWNKLVETAVEIMFEQDGGE